MKTTGKAHVFGDHINTDYIISAKHKARLTETKEMVKHLMEDIRPGFYETVQRGDVIVGGINFGCGSSREAAAIIIKEAGIAAVIAKGFSRIFFRNAINVGLPALSVDTDGIGEGDRLEVHPYEGVIKNLTTGETLQTTPLPQFVQGILEAGGMDNYLKENPTFDV